jgi:hypothetical protein
MRAKKRSTQNAAYSRLVVPRIEGVPNPAEENLKLRAKIHWGLVRWHAYIPEIASAIAGRKVSGRAR